MDEIRIQPQRHRGTEAGWFAVRLTRLEQLKYLFNKNLFGSPPGYDVPASVPLCLCGCIFFFILALNPLPARADDISVIRDRFATFVLPTNAEDIARLHRLAKKDSASLRADGSWADVDYQDQARANWKTAEHLNRTLVMAKAVRLARQEQRPDSALEAKTLLTLQYWTDHDFQNPNWWWNQIGVPQLSGEIACLIWPDVPKGEIEKIATIMIRSDWRKNWTGANLIWGVTNEIIRGCLEENTQAVAEGYQRMYEEIKIVDPTREGIQHDFSFHQHGRQLYNGGYGRAFGDDVGRFIAYAKGTAFSPPADKQKIFDSYMRDGQRWMMWGDMFDYSVIGREITRQGISASRDWTKGPISPVGAAYTAHASTEPLLEGNRQFWCSDYMVHRRAGYFTSVKMLSDRMQNAELVNSEGKKSVHLSDGANFLYRQGDEYRDIFPVWDWTKVPGTTAIQGTLDIGVKNAISQHGQSPFAGGVSDGTYGACAMNLERGKLSARKAWFFFDDCYVCLGSGITLRDDSAHATATDVNQTHLIGDVFTNQSAAPAVKGQYEDRTDIHWVYHNHIGYIFSAGQHVCLSMQEQSGRWSDIGAGVSDLVRMPVFDLWVDHGKSCSNASYQYIVMPAISESQLVNATTDSKVKVLANTDTQAVFNRDLQLIEAVFRNPGSLDTPLGKLQVDHSCIVMVRKTAAVLKISAANPENQALMLGVNINGKKINMQMPRGNWAGSSVTREIAGG